MNTTMLMGVGVGTIGTRLEKAPTGIRGLDQITVGGLPRVDRVLVRLQVRTPRKAPA